VEFNGGQLALLCAIAEEAGAEIMRVYDAGIAQSWRKDDDSPVTEADLRADAVIRRGLERSFPNIPVWSEESGAPAVPTDTFLLVDPLDGTKEFLGRNGEFTVNIAFVDGGVPRAGVVYAPALGELFFAADGHGAWERQGARAIALRTVPTQPATTLRITGSRSHAGPELAEWLERMGRPYEFVPAGSSLKICRVAQGRADVYPRLGPTSQWDTAAAHAVLEHAGGCLLDAHGADLRYGMSRPVLNPWFIALGNRETAYPSLTPT
jgi:3'(2'), 5'-bisphosphate nucleotidase